MRVDFFTNLYIRLMLGVTFWHPVHLPECPDRNDREDNTKKPATRYMEPEECRWDIAFQPHGSDIHQNPDKRKYNQPGSCFDADI